MRTEKPDPGYPGAGTYMPEILKPQKKVYTNVEKKNFNRFKLNNAQI